MTAQSQARAIGPKRSRHALRTASETDSHISRCGRCTYKHHRPQRLQSAHALERSRAWARPGLAKRTFRPAEDAERDVADALWMMIKLE